MQDLIERLEKATGPDRQIDNAIEAAIDLPKPTNPDDLPGWPPYFTASIDAAITLVPKGARLRELGQWDDNGQPGGWFCDINQYRETEDGWVIDSFSYGVPDPMDYHPKVPPLASNGAVAICIAALKARAVS